MDGHTHLRLRRRRDAKSGRRVRDVWLELELGDWVAAYRLFLRRGQVVVGELRLFPLELPHREPGAWSAKRIGSDAMVPSGGITARLLRQAKISEAVAAHPELRQEVAKLLGEPLPTSMKADSEQLTGDEPHRPGRKGRDELFLARVAARYVGLCEDGSKKPIEELTAWLAGKGQNFSAPTVRGFVHQARRRGLLTSPLKRGQAGGELTEAAEAMLFEARESQMKHYPPQNRSGSA